MNLFIQIQTMLLKKNLLQFYKKYSENNILSLYFQRAGDGVSPVIPIDKIILSNTQV